MALGLFSCKKEKEENCDSVKPAFVTSVLGPSTAKVHEAVPVDVYFQVNNGCGQFSRFIETTSANKRTIEVEAKYSGCACTLDMPTRLEKYNFISDQSGPVELRFKDSDTSYRTIVIQVN